MRPRRRCYRTAEASTAKAPGRHETGSDRRKPLAPSLAIAQTKTAYVLERTPFDVISRALAAVRFARALATVAMAACGGGRGRRVLGALVLGLYAPKGLRGRRSARDRHAGLIQAWIEYGSRIRTGQGQEQPRDRRYDDRSDFHDNTPPARAGFPNGVGHYGDHARFCQGAKPRFPATMSSRAPRSDA